MMRKKYTLKGGQGCLPGSKGCAPGGPSVAARLRNFVSGLFTRRRQSPATKREVAATAAAAEEAATKARSATSTAAAAARRWAAVEAAAAGTGLTEMAEEQHSLNTADKEPPDLIDGAPGLMQGYGPREVLQTKNPIQPKKSPTAAAKWALKEAELAAQVADAAEAQVEKINLKSLTKREKEEITDAVRRRRAEANRVANWAERWVAFAARKEMEAQEAAAAEAAIMAAEAAALAEEVSSGAADRLKKAAKKYQQLLDYVNQLQREPYRDLKKKELAKRSAYIADEDMITREYLQALIGAPLTAIVIKEERSGRPSASSYYKMYKFFKPAN